MSTPSISSSNKRQRRQCVKCPGCDRTGTEAHAQENDASDFVATGKSCDGCARPMFLRIHPDTVEYTQFGEPILTSLCFKGDFEKALVRVQTHPKEAGTVGKDCKTESALHWAVCYGAPFGLVRALLEAAPEMVAFQPGWHEQGTPLEIVLSRRYFFVPPDMLDVVRAFVEANAEAASLAMYAAYHGLGVPVHKAASDYDTFPDRVPDDFGFAAEWCVEHQDGVANEEELLTEKEKKITTLSVREQFKMMFDCFALIAKAAYYGAGVDYDGLPLTHALAAYPYWCKEDDMNWITLPCGALEVAFRFNPEELLLPDGQGNTPIHLAAAHREPTRKKKDWELEMERDNPTTIDIDECLKKDSLGMAYVLKKLREEYPWVELESRDAYDNFYEAHVEKLATACPEALKMRNSNGDLPLHAAIRARKGASVIQPIVKAYPEAVRQQDGQGNTCLHLLAQQDPGQINMKERIAAYVKEHSEAKGAAKCTLDVEDNIVRAFMELDEDDGLSAQAVYDYVCKIYPCYCDVDSFNKTFQELVEADKLMAVDIVEDEEGKEYALFLPLDEEWWEEKEEEIEVLRGDLYKGKHLMSVDKMELITLLVESYPEARTLRNDEGKLPFQYFLQNKAQNRFDNVEIFMTEEAAAMPESGTGLYGFMSAASIGDLDLSYRMLRSFPSVVGQLV